jgi:hypothetical protein
MLLWEILVPTRFDDTQEAIALNRIGSPAMRCQNDKVKVWNTPFGKTDILALPLL